MPRNNINGNRPTSPSTSTWVILVNLISGHRLMLSGPHLESSEPLLEPEKLYDVVPSAIYLLRTSTTYQDRYIRLSIL